MNTPGNVIAQVGALAERQDLAERLPARPRERGLLAAPGER